MSTVDDDLRMDPVVARRGAAALVDAGHTLTNSRNDQGGRLDDEGAARPWGGDALGQAFQTNYDQIVPAVLGAWARLGSYLEEYAAGVTAAIDATIAAEDAARQRIRW
jgi:hypothetical protein